MQYYLKKKIILHIVLYPKMVSSFLFGLCHLSVLLTYIEHVEILINSSLLCSMY